jgi:hypothetical protein
MLSKRFYAPAPGDVRSTTEFKQLEYEQPHARAASGAKLKLTPDVLALLAERFKVLSEPARLQIRKRKRDSGCWLVERQLTKS